MEVHTWVTLMQVFCIAVKQAVCIAANGIQYSQTKKHCGKKIDSKNWFQHKENLDNWIHESKESDCAWILTISVKGVKDPAKISLLYMHWLLSTRSRKLSHWIVQVFQKPGCKIVIVTVFLLAFLWASSILLKALTVWFEVANQDLGFITTQNTLMPVTILVNASVCNCRYTKSICWKRILWDKSVTEFGFQQIVLLSHSNLFKPGDTNTGFTATWPSYSYITTKNQEKNRALKTRQKVQPTEWNRARMNVNYMEIAKDSGGIPGYISVMFQHAWNC